MCLLLLVRFRTRKESLVAFNGLIRPVRALPLALRHVISLNH